MATNVNNAERLRSYFLSHKQRENIINVCRARPNWDGCDYCDLYSGSGLPCWKQDDKHNCCKLEEVKTKTRMYERKSETKDLAMTPKEQEMDLRRWCVEVSVKICDKESIIEVAENCTNGLHNRK